MVDKWETLRERTKERFDRLQFEGTLALLDIENLDLFAILTDLGEGISRGRERVANMDAEGAEIVESLGTGVPSPIEEEFDVIENILGRAFTVCQVDISGVVRRCLYLHQIHRQQRGDGRILGHAGRKEELLRRQSRVIESSGFTEVEAIDAFANYFKHREE